MGIWSINTFLIAFLGGVVGTALGTLWAVILCALLVLVGIGVVMAGGSDFILNQLALGPMFAPHLGGFAVPIIASAYAAAIWKNHPTGNGKDIVSPLMGTSWDVLAVGGLIACFNWTLFQVIVMTPILNQFDALALTIAASCLIARAVFTREGPLGSKQSIKAIGLLKTDNGRIAWNAVQSTDFKRSMLFGAAAGGLSGHAALTIHKAMEPFVASGAVAGGTATACCTLIGWSIAIIALLPAFFSTPAYGRVPSWHSQCAVPALVALYTGSVPMALAAGVLMWLLQELCARLFTNHATVCFNDPPSTAIAVGTFIVNLLFKLEFLNLCGLWVFKSYI